MLNKVIKYAKLAWVYAKGMCGLRRQVYDLQFVYVPEDKLWYIDMPWPGDRYNLAMVAGSNHLLKFLDYKGERRVRVLVKPSRKPVPELESEGYFMCEKQFSRLLGGATYKVNNLAAKGYVVKSTPDGDRRECRLQLGPKFYQYFTDSDHFIDLAAEKLEGEFPPEELEVFARVLRKLTEEVK